MPFTTFRIGGPARYFYEARTVDSLIRAVEAARKSDIPFFILGGGSNILVSDEGFDGLVVKNQISNVEIQNKMVAAGGGALLSKVVADSIEAGLTGLEWAAGIPGTVGGAIRGNAGAYGSFISDAVEEVTILDDEGVLGTLTASDCEFGYRDSIFKCRPWITLSATFRLSKGERERTQEQITAYLADRDRRIPPYPSAGCVFKNLRVRDLKPEISDKIPREIIKEGMVPAWYLIDQCGLKGKRIGGAQISDRHANFIINLGGAKAADVLALINLCKEKVREQFEVELEEEIRCVGF